MGRSAAYKKCLERTKQYPSKFKLTNIARCGIWDDAKCLTKVGGRSGAKRCRRLTRTIHRLCKG